MVKIYKNTVLLMAITYTLFSFLPYLWPYIYSVETQTFLNLSGLDSQVELSGLLSFLIPALYIISCIGLYHFHPLGRTVFTVLIFINLTLGSFFLGFSATAYLDTSIGYLLSLLEGGVLMVIYLTEISKEFKVSNA